jgi:hypothetical protein
MFRFCFIAIFALAGCQSPYVIHLPTKTLDTSGPVSIDVRSFGGDVTIVADPSVTGVTVWVLQRDVGAHRQDQLVQQIEFSADVERSSIGEIVHIVVSDTGGPLRTIRADVTVRANTIHGVSIETEHGDVVVVGITGYLNIRTSDGDVRIVTPKAMTDPVAIENRRGDILYRVRRESSGMIDAIAMNGTATLELHYGDGVILPGTTSDHLIASFNNGVNPVIMRTVDGNVRISVVADPMGSEPLFNTDWITW